MALKDKLMTLEDFKAVRDVDVASNSAQFTEIKADLDALEPGLSDTAKAALLACFDHVAWDGDDPTGQTYITALENALYGTSARLSAVFTQGTEKYYPFDSLNSLKEHLVVRYKNDQGQTSVVTNYTLSGTLTVGAARIAVSYSGEVCHFTVNVESVSMVNNASIGSGTDINGVKFAGNAESQVARARFDVPIKNRSYTIASVDSTKYKIAGFGLASNILTEYTLSNSSILQGYQRSANTNPSWQDTYTDQDQSSYIWCSFKKIDNTDFTASEIANAYGTIYTVS